MSDKSRLDKIEEKINAIEILLRNPISTPAFECDLKAEYAADRKFYENKIIGLEREWVHFRRDLDDKNLDLTNKKTEERIKQLETANVTNFMYYSSKLYSVERDIKIKLEHITKEKNN